MKRATEADRFRDGQLDGWANAAQYLADREDSCLLGKYILAIAQHFAEENGDEDPRREYWIGFAFAFGSFVEESDPDERASILKIVAEKRIGGPRKLRLVAVRED